MALFGIGGSAEDANFVQGDGFYLRPAEMRDYAQWAALRERSRAFLEPWEPVWPPDDLTRPAFRRRLRRNDEEIAQDEAYPLFLFRESDHALLGGLTLGQIRRGVAQAATLGYWMGAEYAGKGYMSQAVRAALVHAFGQMRLHRVEAACIPTNTPSAKLLERCGFVREGYARAYLRINGAWQDHILFAILSTDPILQRRRADGG
jgi:ribosomal-protein-alanine N-acetyltransferase